MFNRTFSSSYNRLFRRLTPDTIIYGIIGINSAVFLGWQYSQQMYNLKHQVKYYKFMSENFICGLYSTIHQHRYWTIITNAFSHSELWHFGINMMVLYSFGPQVVEIVGKTRFIPFYIFTGATASVASLLHQYYNYGSQSHRGSHGASGAITGTTLLFAMTYPRVPILIWGILPVPSYLAIGSFIAYDVYKSLGANQGRVDSAGHLGGGIGALAYWYLMRRGLRFR